MAYLFTLQNDKLVYPTVEVLLIEPFKTIWSRDKTKNKQVALEEFTFIEFMSSMKKSNPFRQYRESEKADKIKDKIITIKDWIADELIIEGIKYIKTLQREASTTYSYYLSVKKAAEEMQDFFNNVDINERNFKTGNPIYKPRDITSALNDTEKTLTNIKALEKKVEEELFETSKKKAGKKIGHFANPNSVK